MFRESLIPGGRSIEMRVEIDKQALFALASDTRLDILKALQPMRRTVTQLADTLNIDKAAVHRHLKKLEEGGFVTRFEDHSFIYYGLSWKARDILTPNDNTRIIVLLSSSWIMVVIAAFLVIAAANSLSGIPGGINQMETGEPLNYWQNSSYSENTSLGYYDGEMQWRNSTYWQNITYSIERVIPYPWYIWAASAAAIGAVAAVIVVIGVRKLRKPKQKTAEDSIPITHEGREDD